ncbi:hypothetical protein SAMN05216249_10758 [Acetitomaculum ruminis DSM 5522]|uniref:SipW-cognate class signal peptide n=1 Tax=Acetitomaculum ruminis DSM 5522 TaxID=1120918 RepID=A0A1I0XP02_9FIRM|nr:hypothetical protein [Acetitomaculum ruminis]SFB02785.1 hypothetical protein SAMN05216249_10758 [Acetitomaculum ruminis DSM 5522]
MKKKLTFLGVAGVLLITAFIGGTLAAFNTTTQGNAGAGIAKITTKDIGVAFSGKMSEEEKISTGILPGTTQQYDYTVSNKVTGSQAYDIYVKVTIYKAWANEELDSSKVVLQGSDQHEYAKEDVVTDAAVGTIIDGWLISYVDDEEIVLYYTKPLSKGESTTSFIDGIYFKEDMGNEYTDSTLDLEYIVNAVQANQSEAAMAAEWGMYPLINGSGNITNVFETKSVRDSYK